MAFTTLEGIINTLNTIRASLTEEAQANLDRLEDGELFDEFDRDEPIVQGVADYIMHSIIYG